MSLDLNPKVTNPVPHIRYQSVYGGHPILRKRGADAYGTVREFLTTCTDWDGAWTDATISGCPADEFITADDRNDAALEQVRARLGTPRPGITVGSIDGSAATTAEDWSVPPELHEWAIARVLSLPPAQRGWPDPVSCTCSTDFRLRTPGGSILPGQSATGIPYDIRVIRSGLLLHVSPGNTSAFFDLVLPFPEPGPEFVQYVASIRPYLPIRLAKGNFKHWLPNKARDGFNLRRISADLFADL